MSSSEFNLPQNQSSIIKVVGVGGGGSNAVNTMYLKGISGVEFCICNTDLKALDISPVPHRIRLAENITEGILGAGADPMKGKAAAEESLEEIRELLKNNTKMVFITAGMGGGTGNRGCSCSGTPCKRNGYPNGWMRQLLLSLKASRDCVKHRMA